MRRRLAFDADPAAFAAALRRRRGARLAAPDRRRAGAGWPRWCCPTPRCARSPRSARRSRSTACAPTSSPPAPRSRTPPGAGATAVDEGRRPGRRPAGAAAPAPPRPVRRAGAGRATRSTRPCDGADPEPDGPDDRPDDGPTARRPGRPAARTAGPAAADGRSRHGQPTAARPTAASDGLRTPRPTAPTPDGRAPTRPPRPARPTRPDAAAPPAVDAVPRPAARGPRRRRGRARPAVAGPHRRRPGRPARRTARRGAPPTLHLPATVARRRAAPAAPAAGAAPGSSLQRADLRHAVREGREGNLVLFAVDASGSMAARRGWRAVKGAVLSLLLRRLPAPRQGRADHLPRHGGRARAAADLQSVEAAARPAGRRCRTGGRTPLADGLLRAARGCCGSSGCATPGAAPLLVVRHRRPGHRRRPTPAATRSRRLPGRRAAGRRRRRHASSSTASPGRSGSAWPRGSPRRGGRDRWSRSASCRPTASPTSSAAAPAA